MLTTTYTYVTITVEQSRLRGMLNSLQDYLKRCLKRLQGKEGADLGAAVRELAQFEQAWSGRKMERHIIPALRGAAKEIDCLLGEIEALGQRLCEHLRGLRDALANWLRAETQPVQDLWRAMDDLRESLHQRLAKEEELLPLLPRVLSAEAWFPIAARLLSDDAGRGEPKGGVQAS